VYLNMVQAPHLDSCIGAVRRVNATFIFNFSVERHKLEVMMKPWVNTIDREDPC